MKPSSFFEQCFTAAAEFDSQHDGRQTMYMILHILEEASSCVSKISDPEQRFIEGCHRLLSYSAAEAIPLRQRRFEPDYSCPGEFFMQHLAGGELIMHVNPHKILKSLRENFAALHLPA